MFHSTSPRYWFHPVLTKETTATVGYCFKKQIYIQKPMQYDLRDRLQWETYACTILYKIMPVH